MLDLVVRHIESLKTGLDIAGKKDCFSLYLNVLTSKMERSMILSFLSPSKIYTKEWK